MKINFKELETRALSGNVSTGDARELVGELIYSGANGLKYKMLAEKIYKSDGEIELDEKEVGLLNNLLDQDFFTSRLTDAIRDNLKD